jgi:hypothetical protein
MTFQTMKKERKMEEKHLKRSEGRNEVDENAWY